MAEFTWRGKEEFTEEYIDNTLITKMENGPEQRRTKGPQRRIFRLPFSQFASDANNILDFFEARNGKAESFSWEHPDTGETITVRFGNTLSRKRLYGKAHSFEIIFKEVL